MIIFSCFVFGVSCENPGAEENGSPGENFDSGEFEADLYKIMDKLKNGLKAVDMNISASMEYTVYWEATDIEIEAGFTGLRESKTTEDVKGNLKQVRKNGTDVDMEMNFSRGTLWTTRGLNSHGVHLDFVSYYTGGVYYENLTFMGGTSSTKKPMAYGDVWRQMGYPEFVEYPESAIKECATITDTDDGKKMEITVNVEGMPEEIQESILEYVRTIYPSPELNGAALTFNEFTCEVLVDSKNTMKSLRLMYDISFASAGEEGRLVRKIKITVNSYNDVTVNLPLDLDTYADSKD